MNVFLARTEKDQLLLRTLKNTAMQTSQRKGFREKFHADHSPFKAEQGWFNMKQLNVNQ
jgi:hypothetical protein